MAYRFPGPETIWSVILAGGGGTSRRPALPPRFHRADPGLLRRPGGLPGSFRHTVDLADLLAGPEHRITVLARPRLQEVLTGLDGRQLGHLVIEPRPGGTGLQVLAALAYLRALAPSATVAVLPSHYFVRPEGHAVDLLRAAADMVRRHPGRILVGGTRAHGDVHGLGWIVPGGELGGSASTRVSTVRAFLERPGRFPRVPSGRTGALWDTRIVLGRVDALWQAYRAAGFAALPAFRRLADEVGSQREASALAGAYAGAPSLDLTVDVLQKVPDRMAVFTLPGVVCGLDPYPEEPREAAGRPGSVPEDATVPPGPGCRWTGDDPPLSAQA